MEKFSAFDELRTLLQGTIVMKYAEFDQDGHCYFAIERILPFPKVNSDGTLVVNLRDGATGDLIHEVRQEKDFEFGTCEEKGDFLNIVLHFRSGYKYVLVAMKQ